MGTALSKIGQRIMILGNALFLEKGGRQIGRPLKSGELQKESHRSVTSKPAEQRVRVDLGQSAPEFEPSKKHGAVILAVGQ